MLKITLNHIPVIKAVNEKQENLSLSAQEGFILSRIDGFSTIEKLQSLTGLHIRDLVSILTKLSENNLVHFITREELSESKKIKKITEFEKQTISEVEEFIKANTSNYYDLFNLKKEFSEDELNFAYQSLCEKVMLPSLEGKELGIYEIKINNMLKFVKTAFETLKNNSTKSEYDLRFINLEELRNDESLKNKEFLNLKKTAIYAKHEQAERFFHLTQLELEQNNHKKAMINIQLACDLEPSNKLYKSKQDEILIIIKNAEAHKDYLMALEKFKTKLYKEARIDLTNAISKNGSDSDYYYLFGLTYFEQDMNLKKAEEYFKKAISLNEKKPDYYIPLSKIYLKMDLKPLATEILNKSLKINPDHKETRQFLKSISGE